MTKSMMKGIIFILLLISSFNVFCAEIPDEINMSPFDELRTILKLINADENERNVEIKTDKNNLTLNTRFFDRPHKNVFAKRSIKSFSCTKFK